MQSRGFSLLELSIVLVIIGLLAGGVMTGQSLIRAAEMRAVSTEYSKYTTAINAFRDKYQGIPGDYRNATKFWGAATSCPGDATTPATDAKTCDGNGDGVVYEDGSTKSELYRFWQHLANAGLIEGNYTGVPASTTNLLLMVPGSNIPSSRLTNAAWSVRYLAAYDSGDANLFKGPYGDVYQFGGAASSDNANPALKPEELWNIDTKMDDGKPATGRVMARFWSPCTTAADQNDMSAAYKLTATSALCTMFVRQLF